MSRSFLALMQAQIRLSWRSGHVLLAVSFLMIAVTLLPFGLGPQLKQLQMLAPGLLWVALLMAVLLSLDRLFQADVEDGHFDQLVGLSLSLEAVVLAKLAGHFIGLMVPLLLAVPVAGLLLNLAPGALGPLLLAMLAGAPALVCLGGIGAALAVSVPRAAMLTVLLVMPLYVPVMIFGAGLSAAALAGTPDRTGLVVLALFSLAAVFLAPVAAAAALRASLR